MFVRSSMSVVMQSLNSLNAGISAGMFCPVAAKWLARRSIISSRMVRTLTFSFSDVHVCRKTSSVPRWKSSGKTWMMHSIRYDCAIVSLQARISSTTLGRMLFLYSARSRPSSCDRRTKFVPTKMRRSMRSFSRRLRSFAAP